MYIIYGAEWCDSCIKAKNLLNEKNIPYEFKDVDKSDISEEFKIILESCENSSIPKIIKVNAGFSEFIGGYKELENGLLCR